MPDEEHEEQRREELLKHYFEFFKHLTTLSVAVVVVLARMSKQRGAGVEACSPVAVSVTFAEAAHQNHLYFIGDSSRSA